MKRFSKLKMCLCFAAVGTMLMSSAVNAQQPSTFFFDKRDTYTQTVSDVNYNYTKEQKKIFLNQCEVINLDITYPDDAIKKYIMQNLNRGKLYDLKTLSDFGLFSIKCGSNKIFNYGVAFTDDFFNPSVITVYCKCSDKDFKDYMNYDGSGYKKNSENNYIKTVNGNEWNMLYVQTDNILRITINYK